MQIGAEDVSRGFSIGNAESVKKSSQNLSLWADSSLDLILKLLMHKIL